MTRVGERTEVVRECACVGVRRRVVVPNTYDVKAFQNPSKFKTSGKKLDKKNGDDEELAVLEACRG